MTSHAQGEPLVQPPAGPASQGPSNSQKAKNRRNAALAAAVVASAGFCAWAVTSGDRAVAPDAVATRGSGTTLVSVEEDPASSVEQDVVEPPSSTTDLAPSTTVASAASPEPEAAGSGDVSADDADTEASDDADDAVLDELQELEDAADLLDEADEDDVIVLSLPSGDPADVGVLQPLTATIRGENVYLEGTARSADVGSDYERQAREIWGDKVVAQYAINSSAPESQADDVLLEKPVLFEPGSATIDPEYTPVLDACFEFLTTYPSVVMIVEGHTDDVGSEEYNLDLAARRADAIVDYYESLGLQPDRLVTVAGGEASPLADNETDTGREQNRRIDLSLVGALVAAGDGANGADSAAADSP